MTGHTGGIKTAEMELRLSERLFRRAQAQPLIVRCAFCRWKAEGIARDVLARQKRHRERKHGITESNPRRIRSSKHLHTFEGAPPGEVERAEIEAEIVRRRKLHGLGEAA